MSAMPSTVPSSSSITHPFQNATGLLVLIPDKIDVEEESRFYDELCDVRTVMRSTCLLCSQRTPQEPDRASRASIHLSQGPPSVFSHDIWLGDNSGESRAFARDVQISGWTNVGDKLGGAYIGTSLSIPVRNHVEKKKKKKTVYDCVIRTKEVRSPNAMHSLILTPAL